MIIPVSANEPHLYLDGSQRRMEAGWTDQMDRPDKRRRWTEPGGSMESMADGTRGMIRFANGQERPSGRRWIDGLNDQIDDWAKR